MRPSFSVSAIATSTEDASVALPICRAMSAVLSPEGARRLWPASPVSWVGDTNSIIWKGDYDIP